MSDDKINNLRTADQIGFDEKIIAFSGLTILVNRFFVSTGPCGVRIAFLEQGDASLTPVFRTAINLSTYDAAELCKLLQLVLKNSNTEESKNHD